MTIKKMNTNPKKRFNMLLFDFIQNSHRKLLPVNRGDGTLPRPLFSTFWLPI
jgi:hypothetical protein